MPPATRLNCRLDIPNPLEVHLMLCEAARYMIRRGPRQAGQTDLPLEMFANRLLRDTRGSTIVEAAIVLPIMIVLLMGAISYGAWFMAAHSVQQAANEGARAALAALDGSERDEIVNETVTSGVLDTGTVNDHAIAIRTSLDRNLYTVSVTYDASDSLLLTNSLIPLPSPTITRSARVRLSSI